MEIYFTTEASMEVLHKLNIIIDIREKIDTFFKNRSYSEDLAILYIGLTCVSPKFEAFFPTRKPRYTSVTKNYIHKGLELMKYAKTYAYDLKLDFQQYNTTDNVKPVLANNIINSVITIKDSKKIRNFDLERMQKDLNDFFHTIEWI